MKTYMDLSTDGRSMAGLTRKQQIYTCVHLGENSDRFCRLTSKQSSEGFQITATETVITGIVGDIRLTPAGRSEVTAAGGCPLTTFNLTSVPQRLAGLTSHI